jgi:hypothetical protein
MNSREHLSQDLETLIRRTKQIGWVAWSVAILVMVFGTPIVFDFLTAHDIPGGVAWMLSLAADGALIVGLIATPVLAQLGVPAGWVGTLRYVAGFSTWALQTAGSWTHTGGPDGVGVAAHSFGPVLLFFSVEAASSFQRKVADALTDKARQLEAAEQRDADGRAHRAEVDAQLRATTGELTAARAEIRTLTERLTATGENGDAVKADLTLTVERLEAEIGSLRIALTDQAERLTAEHHEALRKAKDKFTEKLTAARAEAGTVSLSAYRNRGDKTPSPRAGNRPAVSDEDAVQMMFDEHTDPNFEWSQNAVRTLTGAGFSRIPKLITAWHARARSESGGEQAVNQ